MKTRLIPVLLLKNGQLVRSESFQTHQILGNPVHEVERFNQWTVDELIYLDISDDDWIDGREDMKVRRESSALGILESVASRCFMPLTFGGRIRTLDDVRDRVQRGADKITLSRAAIETPSLITEAAKSFGSQAVVVVIDAKANGAGGWDVVYDHARRSAGRSPADWAREVERLGAGEILIQSVDRDGSGEGYDLDLIRSVTGATTVPVIAVGGVGRLEHFAASVVEAGASAAAAANIFHFVELSDRRAKRAMAKAGLDVRL
ncbi:MAG: imidazole glycerol phosphate synthase cyclase subunit [Labilithrix sp.]|nr:imidazole glycerol phosphate synthase cyclase subunit [Labilithrix sp.]MCW5832801.1 imidazole glycerol phosphate synthase cyclase subunit [Labilithrix sp.]